MKVKILLVVFIFFSLAGIYFFLNRRPVTIKTIPIKPIQVIEQEPPKPFIQQPIKSENQLIEIATAGLGFNPQSVEVNQNTKVEIKFRVTEGFHNFTLDGYPVSTAALSEGEEVTVAFTADKKGEFEYYCSLDDHRAQGMVGKLIVK